MMFGIMIFLAKTGIRTLQSGVSALDYAASGGDMVSTWVANLRVHAEAQMTS